MMHPLSRPALSAVLATTLLICALGCGSKEQKSVRSFKHYERFAAGIKRVPKVVLYEGLPHQGWEREVMTNELATRKTVNLGGHPFYAEPLEITAADAKQLKDIYCDPSSFRPFTPYKACGGYHPDYCINWSSQTAEFLVQICFGCHEMKTFSEGKQLYCDIEERAFTGLEKVLKKYRKNRPQRQI